MDTEQTQQWETGSHNTEWGYVDTAAHTTHNTEHTQVRRSSRKHTDWRTATADDGAAVSCRDRGVRGGEGRHHNLDPYSRCKVAGHHLTSSSSRFRIVGFHTDRGTMKPRLEMQITGLSGIFEVLTCPSLSRNRGCGKHERKLETAKIGGPSTADTTFRRLPFTLLHKKLPLELKRRSKLSY